LLLVAAALGQSYPSTGIPPRIAAPQPGPGAAAQPQRITGGQPAGAPVVTPGRQSVSPQGGATYPARQASGQQPVQQPTGNASGPPSAAPSAAVAPLSPQQPEWA